MVFYAYPLHAAVNVEEAEMRKEIVNLLTEKKFYLDPATEHEFSNYISKNAIELARKDLNLPTEESALELIKKSGKKKYEHKLNGGRETMFAIEPQFVNMRGLSAETQQAIQDGRVGIVLDWVQVTFKPDGQGGLEVEVAWPDKKKGIFIQPL